MSNYNNLIITYSNGTTDVITLTGDTIEYGEYQHRGIVAVEVPECVTTIEDYAFCDNELSSVTLNEGLEVIGGQAFQHGTYSAITIPSTVQSIGMNAFNVSQEQDVDQFNLTVTCLATFPPVLLDDWEERTFGYPELLTIYVPAEPAESVEFYKSDWSYYADKIQAIPEPISGSGCYIGDALVVSGYVGNSAVTYMYIGDTQVFPSSGSPEPPVPPVPVYSAMPLTFDIISGGTILWYSQQSNKVVQYKKNNDNWTNIAASTATSISVNAGDKVQFRGYNDAYGVASNDPACTTFIGSGETMATAVFNVYGNIMSLISGDNFEGLQFTTANTGAFVGLFNHFKPKNANPPFNYSLHSAENLILPDNVVENCYRGMFMRCDGLVEAPVLPSTTLAANCYNRMFDYCPSLQIAPVLPATTLASNCYQYMFRDCTSLTAAPELPATTLASDCYSSMFYGCTGLIYGPSVISADTIPSQACMDMFHNCTSLRTAPLLPATTLGQNAYKSMFDSCTSLISAPPVLPIVNFGNNCCRNMFYGCISLTTAPELPATTLAYGCYQQMFYGCTGLNYIKCLATNGINSTNLQNWAQGVAANGTFVKDANTTWSTGTSAIPVGWTVIDAQ